MEPSYGADTARAVFNEIYGYWTGLPKDARPRLYLHGLSLGALNSDLSADMFDIVADPFHGALWSGPPFASQTWSWATAHRHEDSPAWQPRFRDGSVIRFANQQDTLSGAGKEWGPTRIVYLQYASDPVTFFDPAILYRQPDWMREPRGPDVSPHFRWFPVVTLLQIAVDIMVAAEAPAGHGHVYAASHYIDAWLAITEPEGWDKKRLARLKNHLSQQEIVQEEDA